MRNGITGNGRRPRRWIVRMGYKKARPNGGAGGYPNDGDQFYVCERDGWTAADALAFGGRVIADAVKEDTENRKLSQGTTWGIGRKLRLVMPRQEFDHLTYDELGRPVEEGLEIRNVLFSASGLQCWGTGSAERHGEAWTRNKAMSDLIGKETNHTPVELVEGREWRNVCRGEQCSLWHTNPAKASACHAQMRLHAMLLHPAEELLPSGERDPNYLRQIGWCWIVTGSKTAMAEVQGGLQDLREDVGRTAGIPFWLRRVRHRIAFEEGGARKTTYKYTLQVTHDGDAALFALEGNLVRFRPYDRERALALMDQQREFVAAMDVAVRKDGALPAADAELPNGRRSLPAPREITSDADDDLGASVFDPETGEKLGGSAAARPSAEENPDRDLSASEMDEFKRLLGGEPGDPATTGADSPARGHLQTVYRQIDNADSDDLPRWQDARLRHLLWARNEAVLGKPVQGAAVAAQSDLFGGQS